MTEEPKTKAKKAATKANGRLRPGELDNLVLSYLKKHEGEGPLTASAVAKGVGRSSGAVANCLARLAKKKDADVRQAKRKPRAYNLKAAK